MILVGIDIGRKTFGGIYYFGGFALNLVVFSFNLGFYNSKAFICGFEPVKSP